MPWQQLAENLLGFRFVQVIDDRTCLRLRLELRDRQEPLDDNSLGHDRLELVVHEMDARRPARYEFIDRHVGDLRGKAERQPLEDADLLVADLEAAAAKEFTPLAPDQPERD